MLLTLITVIKGSTVMAAHPSPSSTSAVLEEDDRPANRTTNLPYKILDERHFKELLNEHSHLQYIHNELLIMLLYWNATHQKVYIYKEKMHTILGRGWQPWRLVEFLNNLEEIQQLKKTILKIKVKTLNIYYIFKSRKQQIYIYIS